MPSKAAILRYYEEAGHGPFTCADCGRTGPKHDVQPQHPHFRRPNDPHPLALCVECIARRNAEAREQRRAQLTAEPRCEVPGCRRRGTWYVGARVLLCGSHKRRAFEAAHRLLARSGLPWLPWKPSPQEILDLALGTDREE